MATQRLTASDITSKIATGTPMGRNELLPDVPKGMSARGFYGQFSGGASAYSQAPFKRSSSATDIFDPTEEDTSTADTTPTETQMEEVLSSSLNTSVRDENNTSEGTSISTPLDNISLEIPKELFDLEAIKEDFNNTDIMNEINTVLVNGSKNIIAAAEKGTNALLGEITALGEEIETITKEGPFNYIGRHVTDSIDSVIAIISDPFSKFSINTSLTYVGKSVGSNLLSGLFSSLGLGMAATPLGMITVAALSGVDLEEGQKGRHFDNSTQENPNTIAGYNAKGVAVNSEGKAGMIDGTFAFKSIGDWIDNMGKSFSEIEEDTRYNFASGDDSIEGGDPRGNAFDPFAEQYQSALDKEEGFITPQINEQKPWTLPSAMRISTPWTDIGPTWNGSTPPTNYSNLNPAIYDGLDPEEVVDPRYTSAVEPYLGRDSNQKINRTQTGSQLYNETEQDKENPYGGVEGRFDDDSGGTGDVGSGVSAPSGIGSNPDDDGDSGSGSDSSSDDSGGGGYGDIGT